MGVFAFIVTLLVAAVYLFLAISNNQIFVGAYCDYVESLYESAEPEKRPGLEPTLGREKKKLLYVFFQGIYGLGFLFTEFLPVQPCGTILLFINAIIIVVMMVAVIAYDNHYQSIMALNIATPALFLFCLNWSNVFKQFLVPVLLYFVIYGIMKLVIRLVDRDYYNHKKELDKAEAAEKARKLRRYTDEKELKRLEELEARYKEADRLEELERENKRLNQLVKDLKNEDHEAEEIEEMRKRIAAYDAAKESKKGKGDENGENL